MLPWISKGWLEEKWVFCYNQWWIFDNPSREWSIRRSWSALALVSSCFSCFCWRTNPSFSRFHVDWLWTLEWNIQTKLFFKDKLKTKLDVLWKNFSLTEWMFNLNVPLNSSWKIGLNGTLTCLENWFFDSNVIVVVLEVCLWLFSYLLFFFSYDIYKFLIAYRQTRWFLPLKDLTLWQMDAWMLDALTRLTLLMLLMLQTLQMLLTFLTLLMLLTLYFEAMLWLYALMFWCYSLMLRFDSMFWRFGVVLWHYALMLWCCWRFWCFWHF